MPTLSLSPLPLLHSYLLVRVSPRFMLPERRLYCFSSFLILVWFNPLPFQYYYEFFLWKIVLLFVYFSLYKPLCTVVIGSFLQIKLTVYIIKIESSKSFLLKASSSRLPLSPNLFSSLFVLVLLRFTHLLCSLSVLKPSDRWIQLRSLFISLLGWLTSLHPTRSSQVSEAWISSRAQ